MHPTEIWNGTSSSARLYRAVLTPLSWLYAAGWQTYLAVYKVGLKKAQEPHQPVIVVGNLAVGGSGKSPTTLHIASLLRSMGREVVIGCSGYGSPHAEAAAIAPEGPLSPAEWGDEPAMVRWLMPNVPLVVGRRRVLAAELVHERYPGDVLVMDDGFQHLPLKKHVSLVLDRGQPGNTMCLPAGPYREPRWNLKRADAVVWTEVQTLELGYHVYERSEEENHQVHKEHQGLRHVNSQAAQSGFWEFGLIYEQSALVDADRRVHTPQRATALCALGQPERFLNDLRTRLDLVEPLVLPDHDPLTSGTLLERLPQGLPVIVTAKDWVKLRERPDVLTREFLIAMQQVRIEPEEEFRDWLAAKLNESTQE